MVLPSWDYQFSGSEQGLVSKKVQVEALDLLRGEKAAMTTGNAESV